MSVVVLCCCCNKLPHICKFKGNKFIIWRFCRSEVLGQSHEVKIEVSAGLYPPWRLWDSTRFLVFFQLLVTPCAVWLTVLSPAFHTSSGPSPVPPL